MSRTQKLNSVIVVVGYDACSSEEQSRDYFRDIDNAKKFMAECEQGLHASDEGGEDYRAPAVDGEMMYVLEVGAIRD